jgi:hypothetical protein
MKRHITLFLTLVSGISIGAAAVQGLHAQAKPKAYRVVEAELLDAGAVATYNTLIQAAIKAAGGRNFNTAGYCVRRGTSQACGHHRVGQLGAGGVIRQLGSLQEPRAGA